MQQRQFIPFCLLALYTAFIAIQTVTLSQAHSTSSDDIESSSSKPEMQEGSTTDQGIPERLGVKLSPEAQLIESATKESLRESNDTTLLSSNISLYNLTKDGAPCILLQADAFITFKYKTKSGETRDGYEYIPTDVVTSGDCKEEDSATFVLTWKSYVLTWSFAKTPGRERWYVNGVKLRLITSTKPFQNINRPGSRELKSSKSHSMLFPTPVGKSYTCQSETSVELQDGDVNATVFLRGFKLQPFISKKDFGPVYECSPGGGLAFRDETAPIAVGSTLAVVVLLTVTGYGVYRYVRIKKVQYDTME